MPMGGFPELFDIFVVAVCVGEPAKGVLEGQGADKMERRKGENAMIINQVSEGLYINK